MEMKCLVVLLLVYGCTGEVVSNFECPKAGNFPDKESSDCSTYFRCTENSDKQLIATRVKCPGSKVFSWNSYTCVYAEEFDCPNMASSTTPCMTSTSTESTTIPTVGTSTNPPPPTPFSCPSVGRYPDPDALHCDSYLHCLNVGGEFNIFTFKCVPGKFFDPKWKLCDKDYVCPN